MGRSGGRIIRRRTLRRRIQRRTAGSPLTHTKRRPDEAVLEHQLRIRLHHHRRRHLVERCDSRLRWHHLHLRLQRKANQRHHPTHHLLPLLHRSRQLRHLFFRDREYFAGVSRNLNPNVMIEHGGVDAEMRSDTIVRRTLCAYFFSAQGRSASG